nr:hypothetical protein [Tanacetum cinerariifolium]
GKYNTDFHPMVDFIAASPLRIETTEEGTHILAIVDGIQRTVSELSLRRNLKLQDEDGIVSLPDTELFGNLTLMGRARIAQSSALPTIADEPASLVRDVSEWEACPTDSSFIADQDRATIAKSSSLPYDSAPRVTYPVATEGSMQPNINELTALYTNLQRQYSELLAKFQAQEGRSIDEGEAATERISDDLEELARVLTSMDAATILAGGIDVPTGSGFIPTAGPPVGDIPTGSDAVPTASLVFATTTMVTPYSRRKGKEVMVESNLGWKVKDFKGMTFKEIEAKFNMVWKQVEDFIPMGSKEEAEKHKRKGIRFDQECSKKLKSSKEVIKDVKSTEEIPKEKMKEIMQLVPIEEVYVQALQVKHPIIDWKVYTEGQRSYWKIIRLGGSSACCQFFIDLLKQLDREDLNQLWALVEEYLRIRPATSEKEMELWVELKRLYEPDPEDQLWTQTQNFMHAPVEWKLYDLCRVHQVTTKDKDIFILVEKDYPLRKGLAIVMISYKLQVETYSRMANELVLKIYKIAITLRQQGD